MQAVRLLTTWILGILLTLLLQRWDKRRLDDDQRARSWNYATLAQAVFNFGPWSMLGWGWVTRRRKGLFFGLKGLFFGLKGLLLGLIAACIITAVLVAVDQMLVALFGK
jgi:hypothetical protein